MIPNPRAILAPPPAPLYRDQAPELMVFNTVRQAQAMGFRYGRHVLAPWVRCWSPDQPIEAVQGMEWSRVTISADAWHGRPGDRDNMRRAAEYLRPMLRIEPRLWIEL